MPIYSIIIIWLKYIVYIVKNRFSKDCSKVKEPTHHPRLQPSRHTKQNSGPRAAIQQKQQRPYWYTVGSFCKKPPKTRFKKIREINESYLCLQRFDKFWMWSAGNRKRKLCEFAETSMEKLVKSQRVNLFLWRILAIWNQSATHDQCQWT